MKEHKFKPKWRVELLDTILSLKDAKMTKAFLQNMFTPKEVDEFAIRLQILKMLKAGETHREISDKLGVSIATVTRGAREIKYKKTVFTESLKG